MGTVEKAGRVLDLFTPEQPEWGVTDAARALGVPRSSAHDLLASLTEAGLLRNAERGRYRLGLKLVALGRIAGVSSALCAQARPVMTALAGRMRATVHLAVLDEGRVLYVDKLAVPEVPVPVSTVGQRLAPHCSAVGKVLLAHEPRPKALQALERCGMAPLTDRTPSRIDAFVAELGGVRAVGTARDREGAVPGVCCHAAPIFDGNRPVAAISLSVPAAVDARAGERYAQAARAAGVHISRALRAPTRDAHALAV